MDSIKSTGKRALNNGDSILTSFRVINILLFAFTSALITIIMLLVLKGITNDISRDYARLHSTNTVSTLNSYFGSEIVLMKKMARSRVIIEWFEDESNESKKTAAYEEMMDIISYVPGNAIYFGIEASRNEYILDEQSTVDNFAPHAVLKPDYYEDEWYFECTSSEYDYLFNVDIDKVLNEKRVWLNYKVQSEGEVKGVLCVGLEFAKVVDEMFAEYDRAKLRGLVIDEKGLVHIDSALAQDEGFLYSSIGNERRVEDVLTDKQLLVPIKEHLCGIRGLFGMNEELTIIEQLGEGYAIIAPIPNTLWTVITIYNSSSLVNMRAVLPLFIIIVAMLALYILATNFLNSRLIFKPLEELSQSIARIQSSTDEIVYGIDRRDEIGDIANTVQGMKASLIDAIDKAQYDALTGVFSRRYLEENLNHIIKTLSRNNSKLCVMMVDVDLFKNYNDTYGHTKGDACLVKVTKALSAGITREEDFIARYGGEEFVIVLPNTDKEGAELMANRFLENVRACKLSHKKSDICEYVTISIGVTCGTASHLQDAMEYIHRADEALYISKNKGKNRFTYLELGGKS